MEKGISFWSFFTMCQGRKVKLSHMLSFIAVSVSPLKWNPLFQISSKLCNFSHLLLFYIRVSYGTHVVTEKMNKTKHIGQFYFFNPGTCWNQLSPIPKVESLFPNFVKTVKFWYMFAIGVSYGTHVHTETAIKLNNMGQF